MPPRARTPRTGFGVDVGGSGIKGAPVDLDTGALLADRYKVPTPVPSTPEAVADAIAEVVAHFGWDGPVGVTFPGVVKNGIALTAANVDKGWIGTDIAAVVGARVPGLVVAMNDADAAGLAEARFGVAKGVRGVVLLLTLGTGIGSALLADGELVPNTELGHIDIRGKDAETRASAGVKEKRNMSWKRWAKKLDEALAEYEKLLWPDLIVFGGGISRKAEIWLPLLRTRAPMVAAQLENQAGIVGAAMHVSEKLPSESAPAAPVKKAPVRRAPARTAVPAIDGPATTTATPAKKVARKTAAPRKAATTPRATAAKKAPARKAPAKTTAAKASLPSPPVGPTP